MDQLFRALTAGARAAADALGPGEYAVAERPVRCGHCGERLFSLRSVPPHAVGDLVGLYAYALRCEACDHVMLFGRAPERR